MKRPSLRRQLLLGILLPVLVVVLLSAAWLYRQALLAADVAYDRTLLASAKAIGERLSIAPGGGQLVADISYGALEVFEADNRSLIYYQVRGFGGELVAGVADLPAAPAHTTQRTPYAALVSFHDEQYANAEVRMAVLLQPVADGAHRGMATIRVAETLELRRSLARQLLMQTLFTQGLLVALIAAGVLWGVQRATRPVRALGQHLSDREETDLTALPAEAAHEEWRPLVDAANGFMARLAHVLEHQKRFVRDASHQLRTPLAVLRAQVQSARRGDVAPQQALAEIECTVRSATELANQMLALAKVEQLRQQGQPPVVDLAECARAVALDTAPLVAQAGLDFHVQTEAAPVRAHEWGLRELTRNLLHNALRHSPTGGPLTLRVHLASGSVLLEVQDGGPGLSAAARERLFQPFATSGSEGGSGLGLAICQEIVLAAGGSIELENLAPPQTGLLARVRLPLA